MPNQFRTSVGSYRYSKNSDINNDKTSCFLMNSFLLEISFRFPFRGFIMMYIMLYVVGEYSDTCLLFRAVDRQNFLETQMKTVQASHKDLESFLKWLQEAETTVNVLADASQRENTAQDSVCIRELRKQMQVRN